MDEVAPELSRTTRICGYDRSSLAYSTNGRKRATAREKVDDLHDLLDTAHVEGPYVLVGHSYGGMLVRLYTAEHADDVDGVVLIDSSSPDQVQRSLGALPPRRPGESRELTELRAQLLDRRNPEGVDWRKSADQVRGVQSLGELPLIVVTAGQSDAPAGFPFTVRFQRVWLSLQKQLARLSPNSVHVIATNSGHFVMSNLGQPELVLRAIREVVAAARSGRRVRQCEDVFPAAGRKCLSSP